MIAPLRQRLSNRSAVLLLTLESRLPLILLWWIVGAGLLTSLRIAVAPFPVEQALPRSVPPYLLLVLAPVASTLLALRWFRDGDQWAQPRTRLAVVSRWRNLGRNEAQRHELYGNKGIMVSLLIGMMINVPVRAAEYLMAIPPVPVHPPEWVPILQFAMTLDAVVFSSLYMVAFVAALRRVPLFPRLLAAIWVADVATQVLIADMMASHANLPPVVAQALGELLAGNVKKVLISAALWLPYLLLSTRVNVTYRHRIPA